MTDVAGWPEMSPRRRLPGNRFEGEADPRAYFQLHKRIEVVQVPTIDTLKC